jgi:hypothetical protein
MAAEGDLKDALLGQDHVPAGSTALTIVDLITTRERKRVRRWALLTIAFWLIAASYFAVLLWAYLVFVHPAMQELLTHSEPDPLRFKTHMRVLISGLTALLYWPASLLLAAGCTTWFTIVSRRATLRQIQASLAQIADHLQSMREGSKP